MVPRIGPLLAFIAERNVVDAAGGGAFFWLGSGCSSLYMFKCEKVRLLLVELN